MRGAAQPEPPSSAHAIAPAVRAQRQRSLGLEPKDPSPHSKSSTVARASAAEAAVSAPRSALGAGRPGADAHAAL
jgi:hypothetical protein